MQDMAKTLIVIGIAMIGLGVILWISGKIPGMGKLPGDIMIKKENFSFYFPLTTCLLLSLVISFLFYLFGRR